VKAEYSTNWFIIIITGLSGENLQIGSVVSRPEKQKQNHCKNAL